jgi:membrane protein DedA with SNARE-associated domain
MKCSPIRASSRVVAVTSAATGALTLRGPARRRRHNTRHVLDSLLSWISDSPWTYLVVFAFAFGDVLFPFIPSETALITAGALAATGDLQIWVIIVVAALGAFLGDNTAYAIGRYLKGFVEGRLFSGDKRRHLDRAERTLQQRGGSLIIVGRFIPGGRSAVAFGAGVLHFPWPRFLRWDALAAVLWGVYGGLVGYIGGKTFEENALYGILLALGIAFGIASMIEGTRWVRRRRRLSGLASPAPPSDPSTGDGPDRG